MSNNQRFTDDPNAGREAEKYEKPVPSREFILQILEDIGHPLHLGDIASHFDIVDDDEMEGLRRRLRAMERDGQLIRNRRGAYGVTRKMDLIRGRVIGHRDGYGFLVPDDGGEDLFLSAKRMRGILNGDRIVARVAGVDKRGRKEGAPVEVLERANEQIVGRYRQEHGVSFVSPSNQRINQDILISPENRSSAIDGQIVVVQIIEHPTWRSAPIGKIVEVLGDEMAPGMEVDIALRTYQIPFEWPDDVKKEIQDFNKEVPEAAKQGREDLRATPLVTIDGEDSRDFDDAVFCEPHGKGFRLIVAIADVSHYVKPDSALDLEAQQRGNSVYFPGTVIPMLPEVLSNGLCSLNPQVDRLCMACEMIVSASGTVKSYRFFEGVMRSHARLTYNEVAAMVVERDMTVRRQYEHLTEHLDHLYALYKSFASRREKRGVIEFDTIETRIVFGEHRKIERIVPVVRNDAHKIIEECMVAANVAAAEYLEEHEIPILFRVHQGPTEEKLEYLREFLGEFGLYLGGGNDPEPKHYAKLIREIRERPDAQMIETVLLRSLSQAVYCPENSGHFGLAYDAYTHFTSPIRRYPDLLVHRALRHLIQGKSAKAFNYSFEEMERLGEGCSMTERRADDATRDALDWLKCEFLQDKVGEEFDGKVAAVTSFGLFVQLNDFFVEGLVHVTALDNDYYHYDPAKHRLVGERSRKIYRLSDELRVRVVRVDLDDKKIDFELASRVQEGKPPSSKQGKHRDADRSEKPGKSEKKARKKTGRKKSTAKAKKKSRR
ncbi:MAG: ribonuclease R [Gammaproteobacteria bacterium]|nr:ribonuclease R [Gammaproteobacteria bacterium]